MTLITLTKLGPIVNELKNYDQAGCYCSQVEEIFDLADCSQTVVN